MKLEDLPTDVLSHIFRGPTSWAAIVLWKSGSRVLQAKMKNHGVEEVELEAHSRFSGHIALPTCLLEFALRKLSIKIQPRSNAPENLPFFINNLNRGLKSLELSGPGMLETIFPLTPKYATFFEIQAPRGKIYRSSDVDLRTLPDWTPIFPELLTLKVGMPGALSTTSPVLGDYVFACLPRSLTEIDIQESKDCGTFASFEHLPPECRSLALPSEILSPAALRLLPPRITSIGASLSIDAIQALAADPCILPNLSAFPLFPSHELVNVSRGSLLTDKVKSLDMQVLPESWIGLLPRGLTSLSLEYSYDLFCLSGPLFKALPAGLLHLSVPDVDWSAIGDHPWPSTLERMSILNDRNMRLDHIYRFPRSLTYLSFNASAASKTDTQGPKDFDIESLLALGRSALEGTENQVWRAMKVKLTKQVETATGRYWKAQLTKYISAVEKGALFGLPLGLIEFKMGGCYAIEQVDIMLPPQVAHFTMTLKRLGHKLAFWNLLPPSLVSVSIENQPWMPSMEYQDWEFSKLATPSACAFYHSNVSFVSLGESNKYHFPDAFFRCLPKNLRKLEIRHFPNYLRPEKLKDLPPALESLQCGAVKGPVREWLVNLPHSLKTLIAVTTDAVGEDLAFLPPRLNHLELRLSNVTIEHLLALPASMCSFDIRTIDKSLAEGYLTPENLHVLAPLCACLGNLRALNKDQARALIKEATTKWSQR